MALKPGPTEVVPVRYTVVLEAEAEMSKDGTILTVHVKHAAFMLLKDAAVDERQLAERYSDDLSLLAVRVSLDNRLSGDRLPMPVLDVKH